MNLNILCRSKHLHLNDPRCYNGAYFDAEYVWGQWELLEYDLPPDKIDRRLEFWRDLNAYAVRERGESAIREFKAVEMTKELL